MFPGPVSNAITSSRAWPPTSTCVPIVGGWLAYAAIYLGFALAGEGWQVVVTELRVRDPGLRGGFFRVTGQEISP